MDTNEIIGKGSEEGSKILGVEFGDEILTILFGEIS